MKKITLGMAVLLLLAIGCARSEPVIGEGDQLEAGLVTLQEKEMSARVVGSSLEVYFPLKNAGKGTVSGEVEVTCRHLDSGFETSGVATFVLDPGSEEVAVHVDELPPYETPGQQTEYVVEYRIEVAQGVIHGFRSLFMLLDKSDLVLLVPDKLLEGQTTALRAFLIDPRNGQPLANKKIILTMEKEGGTKEEVSASTDERGAATFSVDADDDGELKLKAAVIGEGDAAVESQVTVVRESKLLLTSDKPMYQPGQTMYLRALALNTLDLAPRAKEDLLFEVSDSKGNKVFKRLAQTNEYGVAWAEFKLASMVNEGPYTLRATIGEVVSEKTVNVDRYSLPKFKVEVALDKAFYMAGQTVKGEVSAVYFFGKPVVGGTVKVTPYRYEAEWVPEQEIVTQTNEEGLAAFDYELPEYVVGLPLEGGKAQILMDIAVTDTAEHEQKVSRVLLIVKDALDVTVIPESGEVVPDVPNVFFVFITDPTGAPVGADFTVEVNGAELAAEDGKFSMPASGPAKVTATPHEGNLAMTIKATDSNGNSASKLLSFSVGSGNAAILLRTDKALYEVGETMQVDAYVAGTFDHVFLDVVRKNQTILTKTLEVVDGVATLLIDLDEGMSEDLVVDAYFLSEDAQFIRDTRMVYVMPASDLTMAVATDKDEYLPGETAKVTFEVKDADQKPAQAALGIQVVDEAVFALTEMKPGLLETYFRLAEELQNPTYQIGVGSGFSFGQLMAEENGAAAGSPEEQAAQDKTLAAFAALAEVPLGQNRISSWTEVQAAAKGAVEPFLKARFDKVRTQISDALQAHGIEYEHACEFLKEYLAEPRYWDFWGNAYLAAVSGDMWDCALSLTSLGPDEVEGTGDDWAGSFNLWDLSGEHWDKGAQFAGGVDDGEWAEEGNWNAPTAAMDASMSGPDATSEPNAQGGDKSAVKVRKWFPETLFVQPSLITDEQGKAAVEIPLADSITEWRMTTLASSGKGQLGSRMDGIVVFQDFFVDIDFPKYLTQNDELQFPVAIYNYLTTAQAVSVEIEPGDWFDLLDASKLTVTLESGEVTVVYFPVRVTKVGWHALTVWGLGEKMSDAQQRTVEVKPDGKEVTQTVSARFKNDGKTKSKDNVQMPIEFPDNAVEGGNSIVVKLLPGLSTHVVQGMDSMLQLPGG